MTKSNTVRKQKVNDFFNTLKVFINIHFLNEKKNKTEGKKSFEMNQKG